MKLTIDINKLIIFIFLLLLLVVVTAHMDATTFGKVSFGTYIYINFFEASLFLMGFFVGQALIAMG